MKKAQFPLLAELDLADIEDSKPKAAACKSGCKANPRQLRVLHALRRRPLSREQLDAVAGASNGPDLVAGLRRNGLQLPCTRTPVVDSDGFIVQRGVYAMTAADRRKANRYLSANRLWQAGGGFAAYEARKQDWDSQHPDATPSERDAAMIRIARECGV